MHGLAWPEFVELRASKMKGQFLVSGPMLDFNVFLKKTWSKLDLLDYVKI
jgi:hypothetical protein